MHTRQDYLARKVSHEDYYAQFVTERTRKHVGLFFTPEFLRKSLEANKRLNDIPLSEWDHIAESMPFDLKLFRQLDKGGLSKAALVCIVKEAARQVAEQPTNQPTANKEN